ncbi:LamG domain-containing protein [Pedobacter metabolipauper]|uniref:Concanavalin A-like lectin/glucanase superfamily protein n=1 Tax=Pedobacter metabolipauper TaxID=425513 RepID=A0A4R6T0K5_9SPHI|nr:LamG domain-containing protein [Pedobacter metabolipauper]TDQ10345.1 concanavalin A-like lectin/glucanase superfamily protein [Pedobacter metabolipauper]
MKLFKNNIRLTLGNLALIATCSVFSIFAGCQEEANDYAPQQPAIDGFVFADDVAPANLVAHWDFENTTKEKKSGMEGVATNISYAEGIKGNAYKGSSNGFVTYATTPGTNLKDLNSFTTTLWIKTDRHTGGAQAVFMLPRTSDFWGNLFFTIEGNSTTDDKMLVKTHFGGQWAEFTNDLRINGIYGKWTHFAFSYDAATSKYTMYVNGTALTIPVSMSDRKNGTAPLGNITMTDASRFIIGGFQQQLGTPWGTPDSWMLPYTGMLDEMRIYNKALAATEVGAIYKLEAKGR